MSMKFFKGTVFACLAGISMMMLMPVHAETLSVAVNIPVTCSSRSKHTFTISSNDSPLPAKTDMTLKNSTGNFTVKLSEPKNYHYAIADDQKKIYAVDVFVSADKNGKLSSEITATQDGKYKKNISYEYDNAKPVKPNPVTEKPAGKEPKPVVKKKRNPSVINTGDTTNIAKWCAGFGVFAVLAITLSKKVKIRED